MATNHDAATWTNAKLAKAIEANQLRVNKACGDLISHGAFDEKFQDVIERLGSGHIDVQSYKAVLSKQNDLECEAYMRVGRPTFASMYPTYLLQSPRHKRRA